MQNIYLSNIYPFHLFFFGISLNYFMYHTGILNVQMLSFFRLEGSNKTEATRTSGHGILKYIPMNLETTKEMLCYLMKILLLHILQEDSITVSFSKQCVSTEILFLLISFLTLQQNCQTTIWEVTRLMLQWLRRLHLELLLHMGMGIQFPSLPALFTN